MQAIKSMRDAPGTQREYETIYILRPDATTENIQDVNNRVRRIIEDRGGKVINVDNWGKRKLAYEIKKQLKGIYLYWLYLGQADMVSEVERNLRMLDLVVRYSTVRVDQDVDPNARPSQLDDAKFLAAATTVPDEEDAYLGRGANEDEEGEGLEAGAEGEADDAADDASEVPAKSGDVVETKEE